MVIISIQYLRGFAALLVVFSHIAFKDNQYSLGNVSFDIGIFGVDVFFVISGFIMYYITKDRATGLESIKSFFRHRMKRILPLYWLLTSVALVVYLIMPENINRHTGSTDIVNSYTLFPSETRYLLAVGWTLSYEFYFYMLFSISLWSSHYRALIMSIILLTISFFGIMIDVEIKSFYVDFFSNNLLLEFFYGILIAKIYLNDIKRRLLFSSISFILFTLSLFLYISEYRTGIRGVDLGIPAMFIVLSLTLLEEKIKTVMVPVFVKLGDMSYSLYLIHLFVLGFVALIYRKIAIHAGYTEILYIASMLVFSLFSGYLIHVYVEKKIALILRNKKEKCVD